MESSSKDPETPPMCRWKVEQALDAAKQKLVLSLQIKDDIVSTLPATLLELYEMVRLAQVVFYLTFSLVF